MSKNSKQIRAVAQNFNYSLNRIIEAGEIIEVEEDEAKRLINTGFYDKQLSTESGK